MLQQIDKNNIPDTVTSIMFPDSILSIKNFSYDDTKLYAQLMHIIHTMQGSSLLFSADPAVTKHFAHSDCYAIAEHLLYALHDREGIQLSYMHVVKLVSMHGFIKLVMADKTYYVDAYGVFTNIEDILSRYEVTTNDVEIYEYTSEMVIDEGDNVEVRTLTELTSTYTYSESIARHINAESADEVCECATFNILTHLFKPHLNSHLYIDK